MTASSIDDYYLKTAATATKVTDVTWQSPLYGDDDRGLSWDLYFDTPKIVRDEKQRVKYIEAKLVITFSGDVEEEDSGPDYMGSSVRWYPKKQLLVFHGHILFPILADVADIWSFHDLEESIQLIEKEGLFKNHRLTRLNNYTKNKNLLIWKVTPI